MAIALVVVIRRYDGGADAARRSQRERELLPLARKLADLCRGELNEFIRFSANTFARAKRWRRPTRARARASNFESNSMQIRWQLCDGRN